MQHGASEPLKHMAYALSLARQGIGCVAPNPSVGCVIVNDGVIVGAGRTQNKGRPHAEDVAIKMAKERSVGGQAYITLEPCAHDDTTPSCARKLVDAGIRKCYISTLDPDERTNGRGVRVLERGGVSVSLNILKQEAEVINAGFFSRILKKRPLFTLKMATSIDGKIALNNGKSKWITNDQARAYGHLLRSKHDAVIIGKKTLEIDAPKLTCHLLQGMEKQDPVPILLSNTPPQTPLSEKYRIFSGSAKDVAIRLGRQGFNSVLIEGGSSTSTTFLQEGLVDYIALFTAPSIMGSDSLSCLGPLNLKTMKAIPQYLPIERRHLGSNNFTLFKKC